VDVTQLGAGRLNRVIELIEGGGVAFGTWLRAGSVPDALWAAGAGYDFALFDLEHDAFDLEGLRLSLQFLLDRRQVAEAALGGRLGPAVVPIARVPANGRERNEWLVKQVLDLGVYGVVFPTINTVQDARHALQAMRYPATAGEAAAEPAGRRGFAPANAARYWGVSRDDYIERADVWPLAARGELLPVLQCETTEGLEHLPALCRALPRPGVVLISAGDLSVSMGHRGRYTAEVWDAIWQAADVCRQHGVPFGSAQGTADNVADLVRRGFRLITLDDAHDTAALRAARAAAGRGA
jgi:4-hydroxy-2-oxoheptanedioate aldolase